MPVSVINLSVTVLACGIRFLFQYEVLAASTIWDPEVHPCNLNGPEHIIPPDGVPYAFPFFSMYAFSAITPGAPAISSLNISSGFVNFTTTVYRPVAVMDLTFGYT